MSEPLEGRAMLATILQVQSLLPADTAVGIGATIPFQVQYDEPVTVIGSPVANVNVQKAGNVQATATFTGVSGMGTILNFSYTVASGDSSPNGQFDVLLDSNFLVGGNIVNSNTGNPADRTVVASDPTIADMNPGLRAAGVLPATPTVGPTVYVNPTIWQSGAWATIHPDYFVIRGTAGNGPLPAGQVLTVTVNGATYRADAGSPQVPGTFHVDGQGNWSVYVRPVGGNPATIPFSGSLQPWSTTDTDAYNVIATLSDAAGNSRTDGTTSEVVIDMIGPSVSAVNSSSLGNPSTLPGAYKAGDTLNLYVVYNEPVRVVGSPLLEVNVQPGPAFATFVGVTNGQELHFQYVVQPGDFTGNSSFNVAGATALKLNGGFIEDLAANPATNTLPTQPGTPPAPNNSVAGIVIDTTAPVLATPFVSAVNPDGTYVAADGGNPASPTITITLTYSEPVFVTGTPELALDSAFGRVARFAGGSGTNVLRFSYDIQPGDDSRDLDYTSITALTLNGGQIRDAAGNDAVLTLPAPGTTGSLGFNKDINVVSKPKVIQVSSPMAPGIYSAGDVVRIWVSFDKRIEVAGDAAGAFLRLDTTPLPSLALWTGNYIDVATGAATSTPSQILEFSYTVKPADTTNGQFLNYVNATEVNLQPGVGLNYTWTGPALPNRLAAARQLPAVDDPANALPAAQIVIGPDTIAPLAPIVNLSHDTANDLDNYLNDGITLIPTVRVSGLETKPGGNWEYRYQYVGGITTGWLPGGSIGSDGTASFELATTAALGGASYPQGSVEVRQTDSSGNTSPVGANPVAWTIDVISPNLPASATIAETGKAGSGITNDPRVTVNGLEPAALLQWNATYSSQTNNVDPLKWFAVAGTGSTAFPGGTATFLLPSGTYDPTAGSGVVVRQQDIAGNTSVSPPWTQLTTPAGGTSVVVILDTTIVPPVISLSADTTPGFPPYNVPPFTTDGITRNDQITVSGLEVKNLSATPPASGIDFWEYRINAGAWVQGGTDAPTGFFTLPEGTYGPGAVEVREFDEAGNVATTTNSSTWTIDLTPPEIVSITAPSGTYLPRSVIPITVTMSETVYVSAATAALTLNVSGGGVATLALPPGPSSTLQFTYTVPVAASTPTGTLAVTGISLNGTTVADIAGNTLIPALPTAPPIVLPGVVFDQTPPQVTSITAQAGTYRAGDTVNLAVNFSEPVFVTSPTATLSLNSAPGRTAVLKSPVPTGSTNSLMFEYVVQVGDSTSQLAVTALNLNSTSIVDVAGNPLAPPAMPLTVAGPVVIDAALRAFSPNLGSTPPGPELVGAQTRIPIEFTTAVQNFKLETISLYWNERLVSLKDARLGGSGASYVLTLPTTATGLLGDYRLEIDGSRTGVRSIVGNLPMLQPSNIYWQHVSEVRSNPPPTPSPSPSPQPTNSQAAVDLDGNGVADIIWTVNTGEAVAWLDGNPNTTRLLGGGGGWSLTTTGDFNGDGVSDLVWRSPNGHYVLWIMDASGQTLDQRLLGGGGGWDLEATGDYDGDGKTDIIWRHGPSGFNVMWTMNGGTATSQTFIGGNDDWRLVPTAERFDANGDGKTDIIWRSAAGMNVLWRMNGSSVISSRALGGDATWRITATGDFDGDGKSDILWRNAATGTVIMWLLDDGVARSQAVIGGDTSNTVAVTMDADGDGRADIFWRNVGTGATERWLMSGSTVRSKTAIGGDTVWRLLGRPGNNG